MTATTRIGQDNTRHNSTSLLVTRPNHDNKKNEFVTPWSKTFSWRQNDWGFNDTRKSQKVWLHTGQKDYLNQSKRMFLHFKRFSILSINYHEFAKGRLKGLKAILTQFSFPPTRLISLHMSFQMFTRSPAITSDQRFLEITSYFDKLVWMLILKTI